MTQKHRNITDNIINHIISYHNHIILYHIILHHTIPYPTTMCKYHTMTKYIILCHITKMTKYIILCHITKNIVSCHVMSYHIIIHKHHPAVTNYKNINQIKPCQIISYHSIKSYHIYNPTKSHQIIYHIL